MSSSVLKKLGVVTGILIALWVAYLYRQVPHRQAPFAKAAGQVARIFIEQGPKKADLQKQSGAWKVLSGTGTLYLADENQVKSLISGLEDVQIEDEISDRADRAAEYEVNLESGTRITFLDAKGSKLAEGVFGKQAPDYSHIYFRYPDKPTVYLARGLIRGELGQPGPNSWRSRQMIDISENNIQGILIEGKGFTTDLVRTSTDTWAMRGKTVEPGPVDALVGSLAHLRADDFIDPAIYSQITFEGLTYSRIAIHGTTSTVELRIGVEDAKSKRYPVSIGKDAGLAWLNESSAKAILPKPSAFKAKK